MGELGRRRPAGAAALAAAAIVAVVGGTALVAASGTGRSSVPADRPDHTNGAAHVPAGTRLVGVGHAAIAVPDAWATNALRCGTATRPTVVVDVTVIETCGLLHPTVFHTVWVEVGVDRSLFHASHDVDIDGVAAERDVIACTPAGRGAKECNGTVFVPSENASFRAQAATRQRVKQLLAWIHIDRHRVAVPGFGSANVTQQSDAGDRYRAELTAAGLGAVVITRNRPGLMAGYVLRVNPGPGTMVEPGRVVTVTEVGEVDVELEG